MGDKMEENLRSKSLYRVFIGFLKVIPMVTAAGYMLNTIFACIGIDTPVLSYTCGVSLLT